MTAIRPLIAAMLMVSAAPVLAQNAGFSIKTDDLDLATDSGRAALEKRIGRAERQACSNTAASESRLRTAEKQKKCRAEVRRQIETQLPAGMRATG